MHAYLLVVKLDLYKEKEISRYDSCMLSEGYVRQLFNKERQLVIEYT